MVDVSSETSRLLQAARERGQRVLDPTAIPQGLDHFTAYTGLISSALELAKLVQTEERDHKVIDTHYEIEIARITAEFKKTENAMRADFERDNSLRDKTFETINLLVQAGQHEIALKFFEGMLGGFSRGALDALINRSNSASEGTGVSLKRR
jgi:hypothetical protein